MKKLSAQDIITTPKAPILGFSGRILPQKALLPNTNTPVIYYGEDTGTSMIVVASQLATHGTDVRCLALKPDFEGLIYHGLINDDDDNSYTTDHEKIRQKLTDLYHELNKRINRPSLHRPVAVFLPNANDYLVDNKAEAPELYQDIREMVDYLIMKGPEGNMSVHVGLKHSFPPFENLGDKVINILTSPSHDELLQSMFGQKIMAMKAHNGLVRHQGVTRMYDTAWLGEHHETEEALKTLGQYRTHKKVLEIMDK